MEEPAGDVDGERRGSMCPRCPGVRGVAITTSVGGGIQTITYRCPSCNQTWDDTRPEKG